MRRISQETLILDEEPMRRNGESSGEMGIEFFSKGSYAVLPTSPSSDNFLILEFFALCDTGPSAHPFRDAR
jgi:hypothetical protein